MKREDFTFVHSLRVRWAEVDRQHVVFNGHYFLYFDVAVAEYWRAIGFATRTVSSRSSARTSMR